VTLQPRPALSYQDVFQYALGAMIAGSEAQRLLMTRRIVVGDFAPFVGSDNERSSAEKAVALVQQAAHYWNLFCDVVDMDPMTWPANKPVEAECVLGDRGGAHCLTHDATPDWVECTGWRCEVSGKIITKHESLSDELAYCAERDKEGRS
jgi:hypothetical protein